MSRARLSDERKIALARAFIELRKQGKFFAVYVDRDQPRVQYEQFGPRFPVTWHKIERWAWTHHALKPDSTPAACR